MQLKLNTHAYTDFMAIYQVNGLASCPLESQSPAIFILDIITGQTKTLHAFVSEVGKWRGLPQGTESANNTPIYIH